MPPNTRYTVRLPLALDALLQERIRTSGTPFAVLIRDALAAYLADTPPPGPLTPAASADTVRGLQAQLAALTTRVEALEQGQSPLLTERRQPATTSRARTPVGQRKLTPRQVRALRAKRGRGTPIKALMEEYGLSKATVFRYLA
jgi:hypothetical protein